MSMAPERELRYLILGAQREGNRRLAALLAPAGLTPAQAEVVAVLKAAGPLALAELGRRLVCEAGSPSRLVDSLVKLGHVDRAPATSDRRRVTLSLTPSGQRKAEEVRAAEMDLDHQISQLPAVHLAQAIDALRLLLAGSATSSAIALRRTGDALEQ